ncbi:hypothetical protein ACSD30_000767 [Escherichia coli]|nr:hypothetical protein [Escherichia coli]EJG8081953.1 hypothetical protein [Escherichia coli]
MSNMTVTRGTGYDEDNIPLCGKGLFYWVDVKGSTDMDGHHEFGTEREVIELIDELIPAPLYNVYQRADGIQIAVNINGTACFMRPFKQAAWLRTGFEAKLEYYWLVDKQVSISDTPNLMAHFDNGRLEVVEVF